MSIKTFVMTSGLVVCLLTQSGEGAMAAAEETKGTVSTTAINNYCPLEGDCSPGEVCHIAIRISGDPAKILLKALKEKVTVDAHMVEMGLPIYASKDGSLSCLDEAEPFCDMSLNVAKVTFEPTPLCE